MGKAQPKVATNEVEAEKNVGNAPAATTTAAPKLVLVPAPKPKSMQRKLVRHPVCCEVILAFPQQNAHPRLRGHLFQIGKGGCAISAEEAPFISAKCIIWAMGSGKRYLGVHGHVCWVKPVRESEIPNASNPHSTHAHRVMIGIEFDEHIELSAELLTHLGLKKK